MFNDTVLTAALIDRMTHKFYVLNMNGASYTPTDLIISAYPIGSNLIDNFIIPYGNNNDFHYIFFTD